ncbi:hypothetical protein [Streptosporangium saharense]|uniref:WxL domain-containing protein n=1 Tax=Streptosporangium saharense TaxID=1706840 RepID=A0A7W7QKF1_9ACTN|nr:hypothetical protein [Streptosporangium saharense]MBB4915197.1 hypothetical protein [Streptosporangium saharense]
MRRSLLAVAASAALVAALAPPAVAVDTITTFTLAGGALSITAPANANLGSAGTGAANVSGQLGSVTVTDARGALVAAWTASVISTSFTTGGGGAAETIAASDVSYAPGLATSTTGLGVFTPGLGGTLGVSRTAYSLAAGTGNNSATWNPTITVSLPAAAVAGTYTGTITHSVA